MFKDYCSYNNALQNIAEAGGLLVSSHIMSNEALVSFLERSKITAHLVAGNQVYANTDPFVLACALASERRQNEVSRTEYSTMYDNYVHHVKDVKAFWYAKTLADVSMKLDCPISLLNEAIPFEELEHLYEFYHVFMNADAIIEECYVPALTDNGGRE